MYQANIQRFAIGRAMILDTVRHVLETTGHVTHTARYVWIPLNMRWISHITYVSVREKNLAMIGNANSLAFSSCSHQGRTKRCRSVHYPFESCTS